MSANWVEKVLDCAIANEEKAADFYRYLAGESRQADMKDVFLKFAGEEEGHKAKLISIKAGKLKLLHEQTVVDLGLADELEDEPIELSGDIEYSQALVIAMKSEQKAQNLYSRLAESTNDPDCKSVLLGLAQEEAKHKLRFESEYSDHLRIAHQA